MQAGGFKGFTDTFEDLHGLTQLPGIAAQRLMAEGYGFGGEGDWKTSALVRLMKVMGKGLQGGNSFMEDYTYHFEPGNEMVLGAHMLEICASIAEGKPGCEIHPLGIGGKADPVRLVFNVAAGHALNASVIDMGNRFRLLVNEVEAVTPQQELPKLPVARVLWKPLPDMQTACAAWILAGGAHHTCYSQNLTAEHLEDFAEIAGIVELGGVHENAANGKARLLARLPYKDQVPPVKGPHGGDKANRFSPALCLSSITKILRAFLMPAAQKFHAGYVKPWKTTVMMTPA